MAINKAELIEIFERELQGSLEKPLQEAGIVVQVGDSCCRIYGLPGALYGELLDFEYGNQGIVLQLDEDHIIAFLLSNTQVVRERERVYCTGTVFKVPVGEELLGRVLDARGNPIDGRPHASVQQYRPVEARIAGIAERSPINQSLETGITVIDALVPIGRGQRELLIGNRSTGKTSIAIDTILHQKDKGVLCIYVAIGQREANVARIVNILETYGALSYTVIVSASASSSSLETYLAPYTGCTIGEYFRELGKDVLIVYDDLSNHAIAYREMSLLMRRAPGREAYPGDIFYLHARLLERAGKLLKGGSLTALPIVNIQSDDITAYIPTNLISITDGQIFLDSALFKSGMRPAVNVELSVSRVGGAAQTRAMKRVTRALRLELAQYHELLGFSQFGTELDAISRERLARGALVIELLRQPQYTTYSFVEQVLMLLFLQENFLDGVDLALVKDIALKFVSYVTSVYPEVYRDIAEMQEIRPGIEARLLEIAREFVKIVNISAVSSRA